jgi:hypothetical protein
MSLVSLLNFLTANQVNRPRANRDANRHTSQCNDVKGMTKIRGKKEGSIHQRKNGARRAQVSLDGQRLSFTARTKRECQDWIKKTIGQIDQGLSFASTTIPFGEFLHIWLTSNQSSIRPSTWAHYEQLVRNHVLPHRSNPAQQANQRDEVLG